MSTRIEVDTRPRCSATRSYYGQIIPCDLHRGHPGQHEWNNPTGQITVRWRQRP